MVKKKKGIYHEGHYLVGVYVSQIRQGKISIEKVPKISNLREVVDEVLAKGGNDE